VEPIFERRKFKKISNRVSSLISKIIQENESPLQIPYLQKVLKEKHRISISHSMLRQYLKERLCMSYKRLGIVAKHYDDQVNLLKRQVAAAEYIR